MMMGCICAGGSVHHSAETRQGEEVLVEVLVPACTSVAVAVVPLQGDVDLYVGYYNLTYPSSNGYYASSTRYGSGPEYEALLFTHVRHYEALISMAQILDPLLRIESSSAFSFGHTHLPQHVLIHKLLLGASRLRHELSHSY